MFYVSSAHAQAELFPKTNAADVNPDTRLRLIFSSAPPLGNKGKIRIYDASNDSLADELDLSIPPGPRNTRTPPPYDTLKYSSIPDTVFTVNSPDTDTSHVYQKNYVGGTNESYARHFFPVLIDGNVATISPHNSRLAYNKTYYVQIDPEAFPFKDNSFLGVTGKSAWTFTTKKAPPSGDSKRLVVSADGTGDFSTVQAAIDFVPDNSPAPKEIFIRNGIYEEIVALRNKQNLTVHGESRDKAIVRYANNGVFNATGRYEFTLSGSTAVSLINFTIQSVGKDENPAQAEALYVKGDKYQTHNMTMLGSGDALQIQASTRIYLSRSSVRGYGDNFLSYGAAFFKDCELISTYGPHGWPRNPDTNHGDVFLNSTFRLEGTGTSGDGHCTLARSPTSGVSFPYAEFVLISCKLQGIAPEGWGAAGPDYSNVHFWEYNSVNLSDGKPVDVSKRVSYSRQLTMDKDADTIANYSNPSWVLAGWTPELAPVILTQLPETVTIPVGGSAELGIDVAAEPAPTYQWFKDGQPLAGATSATLNLGSATAAVGGEYTVSTANSVGKVESSKATVIVGGPGAQPSAGGAVAQGGAGSAGTSMQATGAATGTQAGGAGGATLGMPTGGAAQAGGSSSPVATGGITAPPGVAPGSVAGSAATIASGSDTQNPRRSSGGCHIGPEHGASGAWPILLSAFLTVRRTQRRRRVG
jgi:pectin methylesterase-like acyl-CoA thioesterase